jgi:hypothetical protein
MNISQTRKAFIVTFAIIGVVLVRLGMLAKLEHWSDAFRDIILLIGFIWLL